MLEIRHANPVRTRMRSLRARYIPVPADLRCLRARYIPVPADLRCLRARYIPVSPPCKTTGFKERSHSKHCPHATEQE
ncbi:unnamed protein product [Boreogadus saida]